MLHLTVGHFLPHVGDRFDVSDGATTWPLALVEATPRGRTAAGAREPFALLFHGPLEPVLPQAIYRFEHPALGPLDIFIVPVGPDDSRMRYEAIFS